MTISGPLGRLGIGAAILTATGTLVVAPFPAAAQGRGSPAEPRLAWLGSEPRALERSGSRHRADPWRPALWDGLHAGIHGGWGWGSARPAYRYDAIDLDGGLLGGHVGYNWQYERLVLGLETDAAWSGADGRRWHANGDILDVRNTWLSSLRLRAGLALGNALVYATGGIALGGFTGELDTLTSLSRDSGTRLGYVVGGGVEMKLSQSLSGRIEALHYGFDDKSFQFATGDIRTDLSTTTVRAGLTYHFNY